MKALTKNVILISLAVSPISFFNENCASNEPCCRHSNQLRFSISDHHNQLVYPAKPVRPTNPRPPLLNQPLYEIVPPPDFAKVSPVDGAQSGHFVSKPEQDIKYDPNNLKTSKDEQHIKEANIVSSDFATVSIPRSETNKKPVFDLTKVRLVYKQPKSLKDDFYANDITNSKNAKFSTSKNKEKDKKHLEKIRGPPKQKEDIPEASFPEEKLVIKSSTFSESVKTEYSSKNLPPFSRIIIDETQLNKLSPTENLTNTETGLKQNIPEPVYLKGPKVPPGKESFAKVSTDNRLPTSGHNQHTLHPAPRHPSQHGGHEDAHTQHAGHRRIPPHYMHEMGFHKHPPLQDQKWPHEQAHDKPLIHQTVHHTIVPNKHAKLPNGHIPNQPGVQPWTKHPVASPEAQRPAVAEHIRTDAQVPAVVESTNNLVNQTKDASVAGLEATTKTTSIFSFASFFGDSTGEGEEAEPDSDVEIDLEEIPESNTSTFLFEPIKHLIDYFYGTTEESEATEANTDNVGDELEQKVDVLDPLDEPLLLETLDTLTSPKEPEMVKSIKNMTNTIISIIRKDYFENEFKVENYIAESPDEDYDDRIENDLWNTSG